MFPAQYRGALFFADYSRNWLKYLPLSSDGSTATGAAVTFDTNTNGCISLELAPDGSLWLSSIYGIERIYTTAPSNTPPVIAKATATPSSGNTPLVVSFQGLGTDPEGHTVTYLWDFGDGTSSTSQNPSKTYSATGTYTAYLKVSDGVLQTTSAPITITAGTKPVVTITSPTNVTSFVAGQVMQLAGTALYNGVTVLTSSSYVWSVLLFHDDHTHPVLSAVTGQTTTLTSPSTGHAFEGNCYLIVTLSVTVSGLTGTATIVLTPTEINGAVSSNPSGVAIMVDGIPRVTPFTSDQLVGFSQTLAAPASACIGSTNYAFSSWSDGGAASHVVVTPSKDTSLTANYVASGTCSSGPSCALYKCGTFLGSKFYLCL